MKPKYYQICLWLTIADGIVAFTFSLTAFNYNTLCVWMGDRFAAEVASLLDSEFEKVLSSGYGFWAAMWAVPNYIMLSNTDIPNRRRWALLAGCVYVLWWIFWWDQVFVFSNTWAWYVFWAYIPLRIYQVGANLTYGWPALSNWRSAKH